MESTQESLPSLKKLLLSTGIAVVAAAAILVTIVLPAEYGIDPLGTGQLLGLDALSAGNSNVVMGGDGFNSGQYEIKLQSGEGMEYKAAMEKDAAITYTWEVRGARTNAVIFDFHGEPTEGNFPDGYFKSYGEGEGSMGKGTFVAPFTGIHGWYWENVSGEPVTVVVKLAGRYSSFDRIGGPAKEEEKK
jgi:hypothetical protein